MSSEIISLDLDLGYCGPCGNYVTIIEDEGDMFCKSCFEVYPEFAEPIR